MITRREPMRRASTRLRGTERGRTALNRRIRDRDQTCRASTLVPDVGCDGDLDVHEIIPRSAWPAGYLSDGNCILVCRRHHRWIDIQPDVAHALGLHGYSWERSDAKTSRYPRAGAPS